MNSLATEVRGAQYTNIDDVVAFVSWLDDELSFLVNTLYLSFTLSWSGKLSAAGSHREFRALTKFVHVHPLYGLFSSAKHEFGCPLLSHGRYQ